MAHNNIQSYNARCFCSPLNLYILTKLIYHGIYNIVVTDELNLLSVAIVHSEHCIQITIYVKIIRYRNSSFFENIRSLNNAIYTEHTDALMLIRISNHVVIITIPDKLVWTKYIGVSVIL